MKKIIPIILVVILQASIVLGYTVKMTVKDTDLIVTSEEGNIVEVDGKDEGMKGWKIIKGNITITNDKFTMPAEDVEIEAIIEYTVTFNPNGGSGSMAAQTFSYNVAKPLTSNTFTKDQYRFIGWATTPNGSVIYKDGANYKAIENTILYAVWEPITPYTIVTIAPEGVELEGEYTNFRCSVCGGTDHECEVVNIMIEEGFAKVEEDLTKTTGSPYTIMTMAPEGIEIEGEYQNHSCSTCGGKDHECQVVNIMIEEGNSIVELWGEESDTPYTIVTIAPEGYTIEGEYTNHRCSVCGGTDHEKCETVEIMIDAGNAIVQEI